MFTDEAGTAKESTITIEELMLRVRVAMQSEPRVFSGGTSNHLVHILMQRSCKLRLKSHDWLNVLLIRVLPS